MTRQALAEDRGLQPERTVLAWTRTSLAVVLAGGLLLVKNHDVAGLIQHPERAAVGGAAAVVAVVVYLIGVRRRRQLTVRPPVTRVARAEVLTTGAAVLGLTALVLAYLTLPAL